MPIHPQHAKPLGEAIFRLSKMLEPIPFPELQKAYGLIMQVMQNPQSYAQVRQQLMSDPRMQGARIPEQYNENFVKMMALAIQAIIVRKGQGGGQGQPQQGQPQGGGQQQPLQMPQSL